MPGTHAWSALTNEAVRAYYRERYGVSERELTGIRALVGLMRRTALGTWPLSRLLIERVAPLAAADEAYLLETIFRGTWGARLRGIWPRRTGRNSSACAIRPAPATRCGVRLSFLQSLTFVSAQRPADG